MNKRLMTLQEYIEARELSLLYVFNGILYFEDQLGKVISLQQIERQFYNEA
jgi:hypothetical protein